MVSKSRASHPETIHSAGNALDDLFHARPAISDAEEIESTAFLRIRLSSTISRRLFERPNHTQWRSEDSSPRKRTRGWVSLKMKAANQISLFTVRYRARRSVLFHCGAYNKSSLVVWHPQAISDRSIGHRSGARSLNLSECPLSSYRVATSDTHGGRKGTPCVCRLSHRYRLTMRRTDRLDYLTACVNSWRRCGFDPISLNRPDEVAAIERLGLLEVRAATTDEAWEPKRFGPPLGSVFDIAHPDEPLAIINADIYTLGSAEPNVKLAEICRKGVVAARRTDVSELGASTGEAMQWGYDLFAFVKNTIPRTTSRLPNSPFPVGCALVGLHRSGGSFVRNVRFPGGRAIPHPSCPSGSLG